MKLTPVEPQTPQAPNFRGGIYFNTEKISFHRETQEQLRDVLDFAQTADMKIHDQKNNMALFFEEEGSFKENQTAKWLANIEGMKIEHHPNIKTAKAFLLKSVEIFNKFS